MNFVKDIRAWLAVFLFIWLRLLTHTSHGISYLPKDIFETQNIITATSKAILYVVAGAIVFSILLFLTNQYDEWKKKNENNS